MAKYKKRGTNLTEYRGEETFDATKSSPRSQPYILALCLATFLIYFIILREENDIDNNIQILMYPMYKDGKKSLSPKEKPLHEAVSKVEWAGIWRKLIQTWTVFLGHLHSPSPPVLYALQAAIRDGCL
jgi:hypothetical protein